VSEFTGNQLVSTVDMMKYREPVEVAPDILRVLANNPKDYTGPGTNTYIVGKTDVWVIDPGPDNLEHIAAVLKAIGSRNVAGILVTHTHMDHSPAAGALRNETGAKTYSYGALDAEVVPLTDEDVDAAFNPDYSINNNQILSDGDIQVKAVHTPGHFPNHMCYVLPERNVVFSGDHVMGWSTTVIVPPLGNLPDYMNSLDVLQAQGATLMLPSHGPIVEFAEKRICEIRAHRLMRHKQVHECLKAGIVEPLDIVKEIYDDLTPRLRAAAAGCVEAHIELLSRPLASDGVEPFLAVCAE